MELNNFMADQSHVAQRNRRDKLRIQQGTAHQAQQQHLQQFPSHLEHLSFHQHHQELNPDISIARYGNISYNPTVFPSEMLSFAETPQSCGTWKSVGAPHQSCDWGGNVVNYPGSDQRSHEHTLVAEGLASARKVIFSGYQDLQASSLTNPSSSDVSSSQNTHKQPYEEMHFNSAPQAFYPNTPVLHLPTYGDHQSVTWTGDQLGFLANKTNARELKAVASDHSNTQSLSLSLSPNLHSGGVEVNDIRSPKGLKYDYVCSNSKPSGIGGGKIMGSSSCQDIVGSSTFTHRGSTGPLGPFTGYATILKGSKFLKPAQQLLDEICGGPDPKLIKQCGASDGIKGGGDSGGSSSTLYGSNEISGDGRARSGSGESYHPEYQQKKAKLMFMQDEVCKRYKQYHQQMQMVVSSFESVAGLSSATPYVSLAVKAVSRHFRCVKNAISDQLKHIRKALGEDFSSPSTTGASSSKGDVRTTPGLKFVDHQFMRPKSGGGNSGIFESQQNVWRPQRGLPERSVAVLRSWLFEHFLHPYPTDTDKHMLASRTGLSRNQVSNWFINARVRLWKPMVEEIHMLETKGSAESNSNMGQTDGKQPAAEGPSRPNYDGQPTLEPGRWNQEKRSRVECRIPEGIDGSLMGFVPYQRSGLEIGLTLGLRQSAETAQQQQQQLQQQEYEVRQQFGGQMIHDFVG
ncbi:hypothetical protein RHMOL_Rhmol01G0292700 [Rhododendron molle]|uniref:Uncharacterized protein n=2 Tax=Rhododendron molle TaxID=49168 RepID=A0ACC0QA72_RHOML|nr:hypothetical protein RHMOL_Rhmol01G0292700 [Rhododendron molle]KAI8573638.1 hypothetical protein RHMOL_Rhmol01G0292700 [Rhododendron molle]